MEDGKRGNDRDSLLNPITCPVVDAIDGKGTDEKGSKKGSPKKWNFEYSSNIGRDGDLTDDTQDILNSAGTPPLSAKDETQSLPGGRESGVGFRGIQRDPAGFMARDASSLDKIGGPRKSKAFNYNLYSNKKSAAQGLLDLALLMANASQLKLVLMTEGNHRFYYVILTLLGMSISIQVIVGLLLLWLSKMQLSDPAELMKAEKDQADMMDAAYRSGRPDIMAAETTDGGVGKAFKRSEYPHVNLIRKHHRIDLINNVCVAGIFILTIVNVFISAFGLHEAKPHDHKAPADI